MQAKVDIDLSCAQIIDDLIYPNIAKSHTNENIINLEVSDLDYFIQNQICQNYWGPIVYSEVKTITKKPVKANTDKTATTQLDLLVFQSFIQVTIISYNNDQLNRSKTFPLKYKN